MIPSAPSTLYRLARPPLTLPSRALSPPPSKLKPPLTKSRIASAMRPTPPRAIRALLCALSLTGCAVPAPSPPQLVFFKTPAALRACLPQPPLPADPMTDQDFALWVQDGFTAGAD